MLNNIKAVIFDLDGTLVDSMWMWKDIDVEFLDRYQIKLPADLQHQIEGMSFSETAIYFKERFQLPEPLEEIKKVWNLMAKEKYKNQVPLKKGALEFLEFLKSRKIKTGIATSNSMELVKVIIEKYKLKKYFDSIRTSCEVEKGKPSPDIYLLVAKDLKVSPNECLVFEDVIQGIMAGKNAGMQVCAVSDIFSEQEIEKKRKLADYYIDSFHEIEMEL